MPANKLFALAALLVTFALVGAGCGTKSSSSSSSGAAPPAAQGSSTDAASAPTQTAPQNKTRFAKTKFVFHAGLAFGAFHRYIYKPFKAGTFKGGVLSHKKATLKAGLAALFAYHEIKLALKDAKSSPLLTKLLSPLTAVGNKLQSLGAGLKRGKVDSAAIESTNSSTSAISAESAKAGQAVSDLPTPSLGG